MVFECYVCSGIDGFEKGLVAAASLIVLLTGRIKKTCGIDRAGGISNAIGSWVDLR